MLRQLSKQEKLRIIDMLVFTEKVGNWLEAYLEDTKNIFQSFYDSIYFTLWDDLLQLLIDYIQLFDQFSKKNISIF